MAQQCEQRYLDTIPIFTGNSNDLAYFIRMSEALITKFYNRTNSNDYENFVLLANIRNKVRGDAAKAISHYTVDNWTDLKNALVTTYADKRDCYTLAIEMSNLRQGSENAFEYYNKMLTLLNAHTSYTETQVEAPHRPSIFMYGQNLAIRSFLRGLRDPLRSFMQTRNPQNLNGALKYYLMIIKWKLLDPHLHFLIKNQMLLYTKIDIWEQYLKINNLYNQYIFQLLHHLDNQHYFKKVQ